MGIKQIYIQVSLKMLELVLMIESVVWLIMIIMVVVSFWCGIELRISATDFTVNFQSGSNMPIPPHNDVGCTEQWWQHPVLSQCIITSIVLLIPGGGGAIQDDLYSRSCQHCDLRLVSIQLLLAPLSPLQLKQKFACKVWCGVGQESYRSGFVHVYLDHTSIWHCRWG